MKLSKMLKKSSFTGTKGPSPNPEINDLERRPKTFGDISVYSFIALLVKHQHQWLFFMAGSSEIYLALKQKSTVYRLIL